MAKTNDNSNYGWQQQTKYDCNSSYTYNANCSFRLPCGLCKLTMMQCPNYWAYKTTWTCNSSTADTAGV